MQHKLTRSSFKQTGQATNITIPTRNE